MNALSFAYVAFGGAFGSMCRYLIQTWLRQSESTFPMGTFTVNIIGSLLLGIWMAVLVYLIPADRGRDLHLLVATGALGGFTTFSTFTVDTFILFERGLIIQGAAYVLGSVLLSLLALFIGMWVVKSLVI